jgi:hypothetical protein
VEQIVYDFLVAQRIRWSGHIQRIDSSMMVKKNIRIETNEESMDKKDEE